MLSKKEILEVREHLNKAQSPLFLFDNDQDGLCSYLLLRRFSNKGNGVPVKTSPLGMEYVRRIDEFFPDYIFILDQPTVSKDFFEEAKKRNIPVVWIDHHENNLEEIPEEVFYYNPVYSRGKKNEPVTKICYEITKRKEDLWILVAGSLADKFFPEEYNDFKKEYPDLSIESEDPFEIFYNSEIGRISRMIGAGLKDRTTLVMRMIRFLINARTPYEVLEEKTENMNMHKRFNEINSKLQKLFDKAKKTLSGNLVFFVYASETSMSADLANKLSYTFPGKYIAVAREKGDDFNISIRGKAVREKFLKAIEGLEARGGGHEDAVGGQISRKSFEEFRERFEKIVNRE